MVLLAFLEYGSQVHDRMASSSFCSYSKVPEVVPLVYCVVDLLFLDSKDLRKEPLTAGRKPLANLSQEGARKPSPLR